MMLLPCGLSLRPYSGPFAGSLHFVVDSNGKVVRNATVLEVELSRALHELERTAEVMRNAAHSGITPEALTFAADHAANTASKIRNEVSGRDIQPREAS
ncbi:hypothetical protein K8D10_08485 [Aeromonas veronii]|uniref:hypothetical protein n=1 Tax=Aeromonas veronii TaxID=654 RepID=UPI00207CFBA5|nr:hypothetical protein [Aeromonas veronii]MCO4171821.1 hypothetical protein [Aeromonas veronii]